MDSLERIKLAEPGNQRPLPQHVKHAVAYLRDNMAERIALADVTSACGVSERTLLKQFQAFLGIAPLAYLRRLRLNAARNELTKPGNDDAVAEVAARCGFAHLGRFATEYRRLFNETPSATRQRARAQRADGVARKSGTRRSVERPSSAAALAGREKPSLLILPLRTETCQESVEARDLTDRFAATLSRMSIATVTLAHSSRVHSGNAPQPRNAGAEYCLLGRLTKHDDRTRVIVRLVDVAADRHLWGDSFDGSIDDAFALQDRVVDGVLCAVVAHVTDAEIDRVYTKDSRDAGVRDLTLQALRLILNSNLPSIQSAMTILHRAIDMDPADGRAVALLAHCHAQRANYLATASPSADRDAAFELSQRAGMLDDNDALVLTARGMVASWALRTDEADALVMRALAIDPTSAWAWALRGQTRRGFAEATERAIADFQRSMQLRGPGISVSSCLYSIGAAHWSAGRYDDTIFWVQRALAQNPGASWMHRHLSCAAAKLGDMAMVEHSVDCMRRAQPHMSVSLLVENYPPADRSWLDAIVRAGMPLT